MYTIAQEFAALVAAKVRAAGNNSAALELLDPSCTRARRLRKAAVSASTLTNGKAIASLRSVSDAFVESRRGLSAFDTMLNGDGMRDEGLRAR